MYEIKFARTAIREIRSLPNQVIQRVARKIDQLTENPRPAGCRKLRGHTDLWRIRIGDYWVIYSISDDIEIIEIRRVRHRRDVYD
ncbi:type II toxin-antitoxin system RelE family toxin [Tunicatimonas pelagia]|uniref:type II toxin-antitoxin system RelE family toxin n=1 Tax=Tunicatimonas pelagia TaxID=931531 RepID=UPI002665CC10|nr:type II toxin-antitoxin system RelE/ParE family toxin [Tunicatimonas pelagia]WKN40787.1 type II toxin-antitoxin system RelE/ParE family toxin [Tunicatimonas pelagia]